MSKEIKTKVKSASKPEKKKTLAYEVIISKAIENTLSTMQMYSNELHQKILNRAMESLTDKPALRLNLFNITNAEEKDGLKLLSLDPSRATQCAINYGFNFPHHTSTNLTWNIGLCVVLLGMLFK